MITLIIFTDNFSGVIEHTPLMCIMFMRYSHTTIFSEQTTFFIRLGSAFAYVLFALIVEATTTSDTSVNFQQTTRRKIPENHLQIRLRENLKSHLIRYRSFYVFPEKVLTRKIETYKLECLISECDQWYVP
jgi:hypothetical protein